MWSVPIREKEESCRRTTDEWSLCLGWTDCQKMPQRTSTLLWRPGHGLDGSPRGGSPCTTLKPKMFCNPPGVILAAVATGWLWHMTQKSSGHIKVRLRLCHPSLSLFLFHPSGPPPADLQLEVSDNLLTRAATLLFLTAVMWEPAEELTRNCGTSSISH